jgi:hypothetical protein
VGPTGQHHLQPRVRAGHESLLNRARVSRGAVPIPPVLRPLNTDRSPVTPQASSSCSRRVKHALSRRQDPPRLQSAAAARPEPREPLAGLPVALAKSPNRFIRDFVFSVLL